MSQITEQKKDLVFRALENPKYSWRTVKEIAEETGLNCEIVLEVLSESKERIVRSSVTSKEGHDLFTTRTHYRANASPWKKIFGSIMNRLD